MIPLGDDNSHIKLTPVITYGVIAANIIFFFFEIIGGEPFIRLWAFIPTRFITHPLSDFMTLFTSMFMHAGIAHLAGNMLYLWIFGDNVEDRLGRMPYLIFYLVSGIAATFAQLAINPESNIPNVGASGAIAGVLGAYIYLFPTGKVQVLFGQQFLNVPSIIVIGLWFLLQFSSTLSSGSSDIEGEGGVAYMAHVGGFVMGFMIAFLFERTNRREWK